MKKIMTLLFAACALLACRGQETNDGMKVIAHRGGASLGAENSISCIRKGLLTGPYAVEVDVHLTSDGAVVVCHDETLDRTTSGSGRIEELTLSQVRSVSLKGGEDGETVPTLEEVLKELKGKCILLLEVKKTREGQYAGIEEKIIELLDTCGMRESVILQSFNDSVLERFHELAPDIPVEKLLVCRLPFGLAFDIKLHRFSLDRYPYVQSFNSCNSVTSQRFIRDVHRSGRMVRVWTVDKPSKLRRGVDAVITNRPQDFLPRPAGE